MSQKLDKVLLSAITANDIEKVKKRSQSVNPNIDHEYVILAAQLGHTECLHVLKQWPGVWSGSGLREAAKHHQDESVNFLFDKTSSAGKYWAFDAALQNNNTNFLQLFIPTIPPYSTNWPHVFDSLYQQRRLEFMKLGLSVCDLTKMLNHKEISVSLIEILQSLEAQRQKEGILDKITIPEKISALRKL